MRLLFSPKLVNICIIPTVLASTNLYVSASILILNWCYIDAIYYIYY